MMRKRTPADRTVPPSCATSAGAFQPQTNPTAAPITLRAVSAMRRRAQGLLFKTSSALGSGSSLDRAERAVGLALDLVGGLGERFLTHDAATASQASDLLELAQEGPAFR